jgi:hypothetical protein
MLEDNIYRIDPELGRMETAWTDLNSSNCSTSDKGFLVIAEDGDDYSGDYLRFINLNTEKEVSIKNDGWRIVPLGFIEDNLIYGLIQPELIAKDATGVVQVPISELHIVDSDLNEIKSYSKSGNYIMSVSISGGNISLKLGKSEKNGNYTDYTDAGEDYIVRNSDEDESKISLITKRDSTRGIQNWLQLDSSASFVPITQTARYLDPGYDVTKAYIASEDVELCYYVYTKGRLAAAFDTIQEAVEYGNTYAGTVMTSHKQVLWQRAGRAYVWDLGVDSIEQVSESRSLNRIILETITEMEGWELPEITDDSIPLFEAMTKYLPVETIDLTGMELTDVLHFVYRDRMVVAKISDDMYALIVGYDSTYIQLADPEEGRTYWVTWAAAESMFEDAGNIYYSYCD